MSENLPDHHSRTNQAAELYGLLLGLQEASRLCECYDIEQIKLFTDSQYGKDVLLRHCERWENNGWQRANGDEIKNLEIIRELWELFTGRTGFINCYIRVIKVRGHSNCYGNDIADQLANNAAEREMVEVYQDSGSSSSDDYDHYYGQSPNYAIY